MSRYEVEYTHVIERKYSVIVKADCAEEARQKAIDGDYDMDDETELCEDGIEIKDIEVIGVVDDE